jgi:hypothetical protein
MTWVMGHPSKHTLLPSYIKRSTYVYVCMYVLSFTQGLSYLAARDLLGHEPLAQADLLLKLAAGRALAGMAGVPAPGSAGYTDVWVYRALFSGVGVCVCMCDCVCMCNCVEC